MRFGHFFYPMKFDDSHDEAAIQECLAEAELVEELGFDAIWIAEHYFTGECVYGDPLVFASALAVKTSRVELGFGILELPLHNPVRVAIQTALLDNLCQGRLIVGTAKGSNYNAYEYIGFGSNPELGVSQMEEAEELLVKAWTTDELEFHGNHYQVSFPVGAAPALPEAAPSLGPRLSERGLNPGDGPHRASRASAGAVPPTPRPGTSASTARLWRRRGSTMRPLSATWPRFGSGAKCTLRKPMSRRWRSFSRPSSTHLPRWKSTEPCGTRRNTPWNARRRP